MAGLILLQTLRAQPHSWPAAHGLGPMGIATFIVADSHHLLFDGLTARL